MIHPSLPKAAIEKVNKGDKVRLKGTDFGFTFNVQDYEKFPIL